MSVLDDVCPERDSHSNCCYDCWCLIDEVMAVVDPRGHGKFELEPLLDDSGEIVYYSNYYYDSWNY